MIALTLALVSGQEWRNRRSELALLGIIGYQPGALYVQAALVLTFVSLTGWLAGCLLGWSAVSVISRAIDATKGMVLTFAVSRVLLTLMISLAVAIESFVFVTTTLRKDPVRMLDTFGANQ